jgi:Ulp1 family protease
MTKLTNKISTAKEQEENPLLKDIQERQVIHEESKKSKVVLDVGRRMAEKEKEEEAKKLASSLLRDLTQEEEAFVSKAMYGRGRDDEIMHTLGVDSVQRGSMHRLQPGEWLNDEVIHYFLIMLAQRDEELCRRDPGRKRSHFFKSFFMTKLLNEGHTDPDKDGVYEYRNVKRWSKKVPGKDIFALDKIVFPINQVCMVLFDSRI